jgi:hypothetical protein
LHGDGLRLLQHEVVHAAGRVLLREPKQHHQRHVQAGGHDLPLKAPVALSNTVPLVNPGATGRSGDQSFAARSR